MNQQFIEKKPMAKRLGISVRYLDGLCQKGILPRLKVGAKVLFDADEVVRVYREKFTCSATE